MNITTDRLIKLDRFLDPFPVLKETSDVADLSPPAQFRTLSDNDDDDDDEIDDTENVGVGIKEKKPFCRLVRYKISYQRLNPKNNRLPSHPHLRLICEGEGKIVGKKEVTKSVKTSSPFHQN